MRKLRVFLADDHVVVREGFKKLIDAEPDMVVVGEAGNGRQTIERLPAVHPDVAVIDVSMPEVDGVQVAHQLKEGSPGTKVLALTVHEDRSYLRELLETGARGYVLKRAAAEELIRAIRSVADGDVYVDPRMASKMVSGFVAQKASDGTPARTLSGREAKVLRLLATGYTNREIAEQMMLSVKTVETYKARSMEKLGLRSRVDIVRYATQAGWLGE
jgi:DNA-binding NarL/FixJ family response regulator